MFKQKFDTFVCTGDSIETEHKGFTITARLEHDWDTRPDDFDCYDPDTIREWEDGEWYFYGVVLSVSVHGLILDEHAASVWGVEGNFPGTDNSYLTEVANELIHEVDFDDLREKLNEAVEAIAA